ncbi:MAG: SprT-like family protein [Planctomycetota bacterium]
MPHSSTPLDHELRAALETTEWSAADTTAMRAEARERLIAASSTLDPADFRRLATADVERTVRAIDDLWLGGRIHRTLAAYHIPLHYTLSSRLTRAGGKTTVYSKVRGGPIDRMQLALSSHLLFQTFAPRAAPSGRAVTACGVACADAIDAMILITQHEIVHIAEFLTAGASSCRKPWFQRIAHRLFGHTAHTHALVTSTELAATHLNVRRGDRVTFVADGRTITGVVQRITRRATVLAEDPRGALHTDGRHYVKYYVPLPLLRRAAP